jgi:glutathione S-transferase
MKFYDCKTAPSPRRARVFMAEKGIEIPTVQVDLRNGEHLKPEFRMINPHCTVPVLALDDGTRLVSTAAIWRYLEEIYPDPPLMGSSPKEKALIADTQWRIESEGLTAMMEALRNSTPGLKDRALTGPVNFPQIPELAERGRRRTQMFLELLDFMVGPKPFLCGERYSVADIDAMIAVDFAKWIKIGLPPHAKNALRWYESVASRPSAKA